MSVAKRKTRSGYTEEYHYDFSQDGKRYRGVCEGCKTKRAAEEYEKKQHTLVKELSSQKNAIALIENFRHELTNSEELFLKDAYAIYESKPRAKSPGKRRAQQNRSMWVDFTTYMTAFFPDAEKISQITKQHASEYINYLSSKGSYVKSLTVTPDGLKGVSPTTTNQYITHCKSVFNWLKEDAGLLVNPFDLPLLQTNPEKREAFTMDELTLIGQNMNEFVKPIFIIGIFSGLSEGDICLLRWGDINDGWISRKRRKTGVLLDIPILPPLAAFLKEQLSISHNNEYVLPIHAEMYLTNPTGISYRFKAFLESINIRTTKMPEVGSRAISIKDIHSLRHTFAYMAGVYQIPLPVVQSVLGHMSPELTKHYQAHADRKAKEQYLSKLPNFMSMPTTPILAVNEEEERSKLIEKIQNLDLKQLQKVIAFIDSL